METANSRQITIDQANNGLGQSAQPGVTMPQDRVKRFGFQDQPCENHCLRRIHSREYMQPAAIFEPLLSGHGLMLTLNGDSHEVETIVDCKDGVGGKVQQFCLEMCCDCCQGRTLWYQSESLFRDGNDALKELATQTLQLYRAGLDISSKATIDVGEQNFCDDFSMDDDEMEEKEAAEEQIVYDQPLLGQHNFFVFSDRKSSQPTISSQRPSSPQNERHSSFNQDCSRTTELSQYQWQELQDNPTREFSKPTPKISSAEEQIPLSLQQSTSGIMIKQQIPLTTSPSLDRSFSQQHVYPGSSQLEGASLLGKKQWHEKSWELQEDSLESSDEKTAPEDLETAEFNKSLQIDISTQFSVPQPTGRRIFKRRRTDNLQIKSPKQQTHNYEQPTAAHNEHNLNSASRISKVNSFYTNEDTLMNITEQADQEEEKDEDFFRAPSSPTDIKPQSFTQNSFPL